MASPLLPTRSVSTNVDIQSPTLTQLLLDVTRASDWLASTLCFTEVASVIVTVEGSVAVMERSWTRIATSCTGEPYQTGKQDQDYGT